MAGTVLVTGGTGYIAGELIDQLLAQGWTVHTTVRSKAKSEARLREQRADAGAKDGQGRLAVFEADLMDDAGWADANAGCSHVAHVASPLPATKPRHEDELIVPARDGALRALRAAKAAGVTRFVMTSSMAAIAYGHHEKLNGRGYPRGLDAQDIPVQTRIMTVSDIFDALTASDRPYKRALPVDRALDILHSEAREGLLDASLVELLVESRAYQRILETDWKAL